MKDILKNVGWTRSPEQEQGVLRIVISLAFFVYLLSTYNMEIINSDRWTSGFYIITAFTTYSCLLFAATLAWHQHAIILRIVGICVDVGVFSYGLYITGPLAAPWYGVYLWITLGNGFRYGEKYLYLSGAASLVGFGAVILTNEYWTNHKDLAIGLTATLLIIPAYSAVLIRRLNEARQRADEANRAKSDFLSSMSHEIRTPLNGILGMTELLRLKALDPEDKECVDIIHASGNTLARQINEILDLSKIESGQLTIENIKFDLYALISTTLKMFKPQADTKRLKLTENLDTRTPYLLYGDPHKLRQIIVNLVGNAIKFTHQGLVSVQVHPLELDDQRALLRFEVIDTGIGIEPDRINAIFDPFTQADNSVSRNYGGTGLGTTICKNLVDMMGGKIGIQSTPNVGTTFWFDIPFETPDLEASNNRAWTSECRVIYLNPHADINNGTTDLLRAWKIPFYSTTSLENAIDRLQTGDMDSACDALVIDDMPYSNSLSKLLTKMSLSEPATIVPIVLLKSEHYPPAITNLEHELLFKLSTGSGEKIFYNTLHACYSRHSTEDDVLHIARGQANGQITGKALNILVADDNSTNRIVINRMLEKLGHTCTTVSDGEKALNAMEQSDYDVVLLDKNMPCLGGIETYQAYQLAHCSQHNVEFVILTADATEECRRTCSEAGIELFLTKPVSLETLQTTLASIGKKSNETTHCMETESASNAPGNAELPLIDEEQFRNLAQLSGGSMEFITEMIQNFETDANRNFQHLESSVAIHDRSAYSDAAHALKGGALYLGLSRLAKLCLDNQDISEDDFKTGGITQLRTIRRVLDESLHTLHDKLGSLDTQVQNY
jgi:two-component system sensor histidine kinase RpfC